MTAWKLSLAVPADGPPDYGDVLSLELVEGGGSGSTIEHPHLVSCFLEAPSEPAARAWVTPWLVDGVTLVSVEALTDDNWVARCSELFKPIHVGELSIHPIPSASEKAQHTSPRALYLIPGMGFGTGHHETTEACLRYLQYPSVKTRGPRRILDIGTGSGILAFAASRLFAVPVDACDTDPEAIKNALENATLNELPSPVEFSVGGVESFPSQYDIVVSNLYAEVLVGLKDEIASRVAPSGYLILSGIAESRYNEIKVAYPEHRWVTVDLTTARGWVTVLLRAVSPRNCEEDV